MFWFVWRERGVEHCSWALKEIRLRIWPNNFIGKQISSMRQTPKILEIGQIEFSNESESKGMKEKEIKDDINMEFE